MLRGTRRGLELFFGDRPFEDSLAALRGQIEERPEFYRGSSAIVLFEHTPQPADAMTLLAMLATCGITLSALGGPADCEAVAQRLGLLYAGEANRDQPLSPKRRTQGHRDGGIGLSDAARSLVADFQGARKDRAGRRHSGPIHVLTPVPPAQAAPATLYHSGTLRGGQALAYAGNIVIVGDVNPGAEVVASADIVIFGTLRGVAHAGAQGDGTARVFALELAPTQLRIARWIAADFQVGKKRARVAECALIIDGRICVVPHDRGRADQREALH